MFLISVLIPTSLAVIGALFLLETKVVTSSINRQYLRSRENLVELSERQEDKSGIRNRLAEIGKNDSKAYGEFRYSQLLVACSFGLLPFFAAFLLIINLVQALGLSVFMGIGSYFLYDNYLTSKVKKHRERIEAEFPALIEMLTLAIAAGSTPLNSFSRIVERSDSILAKEFAKVVNEVKAGSPFHEALDRLGRSLKSPSIRRFIDALVMAMERGAPIVDVLHRHVAEARVNQRNLVMDKAGKAETTMMIPIVFLILPISVLFALWPSINQLSFFAS